MKVCRRCGVEKALEDFEVDRRLPSGRGGRCRGCAYEAVKSWNQRNRAKRYEYLKGERTRDPERHRHYNRRRWARRAGAKGQVSRRDWERLCRRYDGKCAYCSTEPGNTEDHVIPLTRGGEHTIGNLLPACGSCNSSKKDRLLMEWRMENELAARFKGR